MALLYRFVKLLSSITKDETNFTKINFYSTTFNSLLPPLLVALTNHFLQAAAMKIYVIHSWMFCYLVQNSQMCLYVLRQLHNTLLFPERLIQRFLSLRKRIMFHCIPSSTYCFLLRDFYTSFPHHQSSL